MVILFGRKFYAVYVGNCIVNARASAAVEAAGLDSNPMLGIGLKIASVAVFVGMSTMLKAADGVPLGQLIFFRSFSQSSLFCSICNGVGNSQARF